MTMMLHGFDEIEFSEHRLRYSDGSGPGPARQAGRGGSYQGTGMGTVAGGRPRPGWSGGPGGSYQGTGVGTVAGGRPRPGWSGGPGWQLSRYRSGYRSRGEAARWAALKTCAAAVLGPSAGNQTGPRPSGIQRSVQERIPDRAILDVSFQ